MARPNNGRVEPVAVGRQSRDGYYSAAVLCLEDASACLRRNSRKGRSQLLLRCRVIDKTTKSRTKASVFDLTTPTYTKWFRSRE